jgi:hypothetical protein
MPEFGTINQLDAYIRGVTIDKEIVPIIKIVSKEKLNERVESEVYENSLLNGDDDFYENTFGLRDAAIATDTKLGINGNLVETGIKPKGKYESYYGSEDVTDKIVELLDQGHEGFFKGNAITYEARDFIEKAQNDLTKNNTLKKRITNKLKSLGYVISRLRS